MTAAQIAQQPIRFDELNTVALPTRLVAKGFGQMRLANAAR
jgi:hypothetical protein